MSYTPDNAKLLNAYANDLFCTLTGFTREELIGQPHSIVRHPDVPKAVYKGHAGHHPCIWCSVRSIASTTICIANSCRTGTHAACCLGCTPPSRVTAAKNPCATRAAATRRCGA